MLCCCTINTARISYLQTGPPSYEPEIFVKDLNADQEKFNACQTSHVNKDMLVDSESRFLRSNRGMF